MPTSIMEGGFTLIWKRVELFHELALGLMAFLSGALIPLDRLPSWMAEIGRFAPHQPGRRRPQDLARQWQYIAAIPR